MIHCKQNGTSSTLERNKQILERFIHSIKSEVTQVNSIDYIHAYMRHCRLHEEGEGEEQPAPTRWRGRRRKEGEKWETAKKTEFTDMIGYLMN